VLPYGSMSYVSRQDAKEQRRKVREQGFFWLFSLRNHIL
jgi:hypothetical protein